MADSRTKSGALALDLPKALKAVLQSAGISVDAGQNACTVEDANLFSYRRDGVTGRQAGLVKL
jgi:copper oxidase (laccase) domain-containing protein